MSKYPVVISTCYRASNTGQLAGAVAIELAKENSDFTLVCLPAVAIDKDTGLDKVKEAELFVVIEGCPVMCCTKIVDQHSGRQPDIRVEMVQDYAKKRLLPWCTTSRIKIELRRMYSDATARCN